MDDLGRRRVVAAILIFLLFTIALIGEAMHDRTLRNRALGFLGMAGACLVCLVIAVWLLFGAAQAHDDGRYANSPLKSWFDSLKSPGGGPCCSQSDGMTVADPDWDTKDGHYRVRLKDVDGNMEWVDVPDDKVITEPNRAGPTMVWPYFINGHPVVRCFMPGTMT